VLAALAFMAASGYLVGRRIWLAFPLALGALFLVGAFAIQARNSQPPADNPGIEFAQDEEVRVTAHVIHEGTLRTAGFGGVRQSVDVETEEVTRQESTTAVRTGVRLAIYGTASDEESEEDNQHASVFHYGQRLSFTGKLHAPRNFGNPGAFDYKGYLTENKISLLGWAKSTKVAVLPGFAGSQLERLRQRVHRSIVQRIHALWKEEDAALMDAAVIGESGFVTPSTRLDFQRSGTYHILVVSGMNVSILAFVGFVVMRRLHLNEVLASFLTVGLCTAYALVTEVGPPVWRAVLMLTVYLVVRLLYRGRSIPNAVGAAALAVMAADPKSLLGASFQLTFLSVWILGAIVLPVLERTSAPYVHGLRFLSSPDFDRTLRPRVAQMRLDLRMLAERFERFVGTRFAQAFVGLCAYAALSTYEVLCVAALMQCGLALPMAYYFHRATVTGVPANSLAVPLTGVLMPFAVAAVALSYVWTPLARIPALVAAASLHGITGTVRSLGALRIADYRVAMPEPSTIFISACGLALAMVLVWKRRAVALCAVALLGVIGLWVSAAVPAPHVRAGSLEVTAIDVGQGDSLLVVSPQGRTLLVDAGGPVGGQQTEFDFGENVVSPYLWERRISRLDSVAITHGHSDHIGGMHSVLNNFRPRELWIGALPPTPAIRDLVEFAKRLGIKVIRRVDGESFDFGGMQVSVYSPPESWQTSAQARNNDSLVLRLHYRESSALLEGDAEGMVERRMALSRELRSDLLKVGHHGSATSSTPEFMNAVRPHWAIISVGNGNRFGHPRLATLERLQEAGVATYRTDLNGAVSFYLDGRSVTPHLACLR
jgi:competence protein ComEC